MSRLFLLSLSLCAAMTFLACSEQEAESETPQAQPTPEAPAPAPLFDQKTVHLETYKTRTGKSFIVTVKPLSASVSRITVQGMGFPESQEIFSYRQSDPVENAQLADLNGDGFEELYLITRSVGSGSYAKLQGFASVKDKKIVEIEVPPFEGPYYAGYQGKEVFTFQGNSVIHFFPVYNEGDTNANPTGGSRLIFYELEGDENGMRLVLKSAQKTSQTTPLG